MPNETMETRLDAIDHSLELAAEALTSIRSELQINVRIEAANSREIEKLKRHVAKLQHAGTRETIPAHDTHEDGL